MLPTRVKALGCSLAGTNQTCCMTRAHSCCLHGNTFSRQHIQQACQRCVWMCYASITCAYAYAVLLQSLRKTGCTCLRASADRREKRPL